MTEEFAHAFAIARRAGLMLVPHAGELLGAAAVAETLDAIGPERLGHGVRSVEDPRVLERVVREGVALEVCPLSNVSLGVYDVAEDVPLRALVDAGARVALGADDPLIFGSRLADQYATARVDHGFTDARAGVAGARRRWPRAARRRTWWRPRSATSTPGSRTDRAPTVREVGRPQKSLSPPLLDAPRRRATLKVAHRGRARRRVRAVSEQLSKLLADREHPIRRARDVFRALGSARRPGFVHRRSAACAAVHSAGSGLVRGPNSRWGASMERKHQMWPTYAAEVVRARASLRLGDEVGLALRAERQRLGMSQRAYAAHRGWTLGTVIRLESAADAMKLGDVDAALDGTAFQLCLCHRPPGHEPGVAVLPAPDSPHSPDSPAADAEPPPSEPPPARRPWRRARRVPGLPR